MRAKDDKEKNLRTHTISMRLNSEESARLDRLRGPIRRGTYLRLLLVGHTPVQVPALNRQAYSELARAAANLNQIAQRLNSQMSVEAKEIMQGLSNFRLQLLVNKKGRK